MLRVLPKKFSEFRPSPLHTGGPRNSRTFYLRIRLFAVIKNVPKFSIRGSLTIIPSLICSFWMKFGLKLHKSSKF